MIEYRELGWVWNPDNDSRYESVNIRSLEPVIVVSSEKGKIILTVDSVMGQVSTKINVECLGNKFNLEIKSGEKINLIKVISDFIKDLNDQEKKEIYNEIKTGVMQWGGIILLAEIKSEKDFDFIYTIEGISNRKKRLDLGCEYSINIAEGKFSDLQRNNSSPELTVPIKLEKISFMKYKEKEGIIEWFSKEKGFGFIKDSFEYTEGFNRRRAVSKKEISKMKQNYIDSMRIIAEKRTEIPKNNIGRIILLIDAYIATGANPSWFADAWKANLANLESEAVSESQFTTAVTGLCRSLAEGTSPIDKRNREKLSILIRDRNNLDEEKGGLFFHKSQLLFMEELIEDNETIVYFNLGEGRKGPEALKISNVNKELSNDQFTGEIDLQIGINKSDIEEDRWLSTDYSQSDSLAVRGDFDVQLVKSYYCSIISDETRNEVNKGDLIMNILLVDEDSKKWRWVEKERPDRVILDNNDIFNPKLILKWTYVGDFTKELEFNGTWPYLESLNSLGLDIEEENGIWIVKQLFSQNITENQVEEENGANCLWYRLNEIGKIVKIENTGFIDEDPEIEWLSDNKVQIKIKRRDFSKYEQHVFEETFEYDLKGMIQLLKDETTVLKLGYLNNQNNQTDYSDGRKAIVQNELMGKIGVQIRDWFEAVKFPKELELTVKFPKELENLGLLVSPNLTIYIPCNLNKDIEIHGPDFSKITFNIIDAVYRNDSESNPYFDLIDDMNNIWSINLSDFFLQNRKRIMLKTYKFVEPSIFTQHYDRIAGRQSDIKTTSSMIPKLTNDAASTMVKYHNNKFNFKWAGWQSKKSHSVESDDGKWEIKLEDLDGDISINLTKLT